MANRKINFNDNLKIYWEFLSKYKGLLLVTAAVSLIIEVLSLTEKLIFKEVVDNGTAFGEKTITVDMFTHILFLVAVVFIAAIIIRALAKWIVMQLITNLETKLIRDLKQKYYNHIIRLSHSFHVTHKTGSLIARIGRGAGAIERMTDFIVWNILPIIFQLILVGTSLVYFAWSSAIIVFSTIAVFVGYSVWMQGIQRKENDKLNRIEDREKANIADSFTNIDSIKYFGKELFKIGNYSEINLKATNALKKFWNYYSWSDAGQNLILGIGTFLLIYFPIKSLLAGTMTLGTVVLIYTVYGSMFGYVYSFMHGLRGYYRSMIDFHDLFQYGKIEQEVKDKENAIDVKIQKGEIEFKNVSFNYKEKKNIFSNFSLKINPGEKVALVGHSGSGKTTIIKLLYRFYDVTKGAILIDKEDIRSFKQEALRSELSIVPQEGVLFDDTIYNNIKFSNPDASRKEVLAAIKAAQLDKLIKGLPKKENTIVGERGVKLSGGERQRVSIARALLANKKIIVLDEATSSLDSQTEHDIQNDLKKLLEGRTAVIIAHRLSTIMHADKIVVLEKGKIVQTGTHNELISKPGLYQKLWSLQKGGYLQD